MTGYELLRQTWPAQAQRIIEAAQAQDKAGTEFTLTKEHSSPSALLACLFLWHKTPEGWDYWNKLAQRAKS